MTKLSTIPVDKSKMGQFLNDLWDAVASLKSREEVKFFLYDLLTHTEQKMLAKRLQIAIRLVKEKSYGEIQDELKVSAPTITKVSNWLKTGATTLEKIVRRIIADKDEQEKIHDLRKNRYMSGDLLLPAIDAGVQVIKSLIKKKTR